MEGGIDCLLEVTARFFKTGDKTNENLEDCFTSYGNLFNDKSEEYWELRPPKEQDTNEGVLNCFDVESDEHYVILKDFITFNFSTIFFGDFGCTGTASSRRGSGVYFDELSIEEHFEGCEDALVTYAQEEKAKWDADRKRMNTYHPSSFAFTTPHDAKPMSEDTDLVKFILALEYNVESVGWEYNSSVEIAGKVDMSMIKEIIIRS